MPGPVLVLLHSPFVDAPTWRPVADALAARGRRVAVPSMASVFAGPGPYRPGYAAAAARAVPDDAAGSAVLVAHSGAGSHVPEVAAALEAAGTAVAGAVYADAGLPHPGRAWSAQAPAELRDHVLGMASDGVLPPWHTWFPDGTLEALLPDAGQREDFRARTDAVRVPTAYLEEPAAALPEPGPAAYAVLSAAYAERGEEAERAGLPTRRLDLHHLAPLTHPDTVAGVLDELVAALAEIRGRAAGGGRVAGADARTSDGPR
jgi:hypothetical protein